MDYNVLFAIRLELLDNYQDENIIIRELKIFLQNNGFDNIDQVNDFLLEFYQNFGIDINIETIRNINLENQDQVLNVDNYLNEINNFFDIMDQLLADYNDEDLEDVVITLKDDKKITKIKKLSDDDEKCSVCLEKINKDEDIWKLPCNHFYHQDCIKKWLTEYNYKCPICREPCGESQVKI